jgi:probable HAF family extracellular repeat protein
LLGIDVYTEGRVGDGGVPPPSVGDGGAQPPPDSGGDRPCGAAGQPCCVKGTACGSGLGCSARGECAECASFRGVGILPGDIASYALALSGDGNVVVGYSIDPTGHHLAIRELWRRASGPLSLGSLGTGGLGSRANATSRDGYAVVGEDLSAVTRAFRWTPDSGITDLGLISGDGAGTVATGVSADGNVVVGYGWSETLVQQAFVWRPGSSFLFTLTGLQRAEGVSGDGNRTLGTTDDAAFISAADILQPLDLSGVGAFVVSAISADGLVVVGLNAAPGGFRWQDGMVQTLDVFADDTNADGSVVVGTGTTCSGGQAAIWQAVEGTQSIACERLPAGVVPQGWFLDSARAVSDDGTVVAGLGINPSGADQGWVAVLGPDCRGP